MTDAHEGKRGRVPRRWRGAAAILVLLLLSVLFFPGLFSGGALYYRDLFRVHHPAKTIGLESAAEGRLPWWSDRHSLGQPFLADPNFTPLYPDNLLYLVLPFNAAFNLHVVLHIFLCGLFALLLARRLRLCWPAALVAAGGLAFSGYSLSLGNFYNAVASAAWLPLVLLLFHVGCAKAPGAGPPGWRQTAGCAAGAGLALALQFLGGEPVILFLTAGLLVLAAAGGTVLGRVHPARTALFLPLAAVLAALAAGAQLLPSLELIPFTARGTGFTLAEASRHSVPPFRLLELLCPGLFGDPHALSFWGFWGHGWFDGNFPYIISIHAGAGVLLLALAAPFAGRPRLALALWLGVLLFGGLALGRHAPLFALLYNLVPGADVMRYPVKFLLPALACLTLLAGLGADLVWKGDRQRGAALAAAVVGLCCGLLGTALLLGWLPGVETLLEARGVPDIQVVPAALGMTAAMVRGLAMAACAALLLAAGLVLHGRWRRAAAGALFLLIAADLLSAHGGLNPVAPPGFYTDPSPLRQALDEHERQADGSGGPFRVYHDSGKEIPSVTLRAPENDRLWHFDWMRRTLFPMTADLEFAFEPNWDGLYLEPAVKAAQVARTLPDHRRAAFLGLFNVRYVVQFRPPADPLFRELARWSGGANLEAHLLLNRACLPRARWVPRAMRRATEPEIVGVLVSPAFDPRRHVVLPGAPAGEFAEDGTVADVPKAACTVTRRGGVEVEVAVDCPADGYLVLADSWAPGWRAEVDGAPALVERANLAQRAVRVPAGKHTVAFRYRPRWRVAGPLVSLAGLMLAGGVILISLTGKRPWRAGEET